MGALLWRAVPWVAGLGVLVAIFVLTAYATADSDDGSSAAPATAEVARSGGPCVTVLPGPSAQVVDCSQANDGRVVAMARDHRDCPRGTEARRMQGDTLFTCLDP